MAPPTGKRKHTNTMDVDLTEDDITIAKQQICDAFDVTAEQTKAELLEVMALRTDAAPNAQYALNILLSSVINCPVAFYKDFSIGEKKLPARVTSVKNEILNNLLNTAVLLLEDFPEKSRFCAQFVISILAAYVHDPSIRRRTTDTITRMKQRAKDQKSIEAVGVPQKFYTMWSHYVQDRANFVTRINATTNEVLEDLNAQIKFVKQKREDAIKEWTLYEEYKEHTGTQESDKTRANASWILLTDVEKAQYNHDFDDWWNELKKRRRAGCEKTFLQGILKTGKLEAYGRDQNFRYLDKVRHDINIFRDSSGSSKFVSELEEIKRNLRYEIAAGEATAVRTTDEGGVADVRAMPGIVGPA